MREEICSRKVSRLGERRDPHAGYTSGSSHFSFIQRQVLMGILVNGPLGASVKQGSDKIIFASRYRSLFVFKLTRHFLAPQRRARIFAGDIVELAHPRSHTIEVSRGVGAARAQCIRDTCLIPLDSHGLNHRVKNPALLLPAFHAAFGGSWHCRGGFVRGRGRWTLQQGLRWRRAEQRRARHRSCSTQELTSL